MLIIFLEIQMFFFKVNRMVLFDRPLTVILHSFLLSFGCWNFFDEFIFIFNQLVINW